MSEAASFEAFYSHTGGCRTCRPTSGVLCDEGQQLHNAWRQAADADQAEQKREPDNRRRGQAPPLLPHSARAVCRQAPSDSATPDTAVHRAFQPGET